MKTFKQVAVTGVFALFATIGLATAPMLAVGASPADQVTKGLNATGTNSNTCGKDGKSACTLGDSIKTVINVLLFILGAIAVIMIIIGGIKYTVSNGDPSQITSAKNTIMYSVIGLVVALLAYAIVNFIVTQFT